MSDQPNIELIKKTYAAFAAGDVQGILNNIADDAGWTNYGSPTVPYTGACKGKAEILGFFQGIAESTTGGMIAADRFFADGDTVVALGRYRSTVRGTGKQIDTPIVHVFTIRDGKIANWEGFSNSEHVAEAHTGKAASAR